jgi:nucleotide-binding universal stress UspA family protein
MSMLVPNAPAVVVGYDGSAMARGALLFAADEAVRRDRPLRVLCAHEGEPGLLGLTDAETEKLLQQAAELVSPLIPVNRVVLKDPRGAANYELIEESVGAELVVVGRGELGALGAVLGSVALDVITAADCPVVVVGDTEAPHVPHTGPVVVGVDLATGATEPLVEGFLEAGLRSRELVVLYAWQDTIGDAFPLGLRPEHAPAEVEARLHELVGPFREKHPEVSVTEICRVGSAAHLLLEVGSAASMIVIGARGRGLVRGTILGSLGQTLTRHATCPLLIARARHTR